MNSGRHLLSISDLSDDTIRFLAERGAWFAATESRDEFPLRGRVVGSYFTTTSTRTRTAFASAALRLGAAHIGYGPGDLQLNTGETLHDTGAVLGRMLDALVVRTADDPSALRALARDGGMSVINAMTADEHPTQALADLTTLLRRFGRVDGLRVLYVGEGNNTAVALALALSRFSEVAFSLCTPPGYHLDPCVLGRADEEARIRGGYVTEYADLATAMSDADVVYTTRWQTTGTTKQDPGWARVFQPFQVSESLMERHPRAVFMHDLPAHRGQEVTADVLEGPSSIVFDQAENKLHSAKAVLEWCLADD